MFVSWLFLCVYYAGSPKARPASARPPQMTLSGRRSMWNKSEASLMTSSPRMRRASSCHASDSELSPWQTPKRFS